MASTRGSTPLWAAAFEPELWLCNQWVNLTQRLDAPDILTWTPTTCPRTLSERHSNGAECAVLTFTLPPVAAAAAAAAAAALLTPPATYHEGTCILRRPARRTHAHRSPAPVLL
jgi:hypothetical protein